MPYYVEQYRASDGLLSGRIDVSDEADITRDRIELSVAVRSHSGYKTRQVETKVPRPCFSPIEQPIKQTV